MSNHPVSLLEQGTWRVDGSRSTVGFLIRHLGVATVAAGSLRSGARST
jgi:polyisoprenoid-binding protein YceI